MQRIPFSLATKDEALREAVAVLKKGGVLVYPTETCYGLGVDAANEAAVSHLLAYKGGRQNKAVSIAVADVEMAQQYVQINGTAEHLMSEFLPGAVTVICKSLDAVDKRLVSDKGTLGIRIPDYPLSLALIRAFGGAITATSANTSGKKAPYSWDDLVRYTTKKRLEMIDLFLDAGSLPHNPPSTVVDTTGDNLEIVRKGVIQFDSPQTAMRRSSSEKETQDIGVSLFESYVDRLWKTPVIFALQGDLGVGKTQLVKGIAQALGIREVVNSPTYQIVREYPHKCGKVGGKLIHIDTWRLEDVSELQDWQVGAWIKPGNVVAIEWMEKAVDWIRGLPRPFTVVWVDITGSGDEVRQIRYFSERL